MVADAGCAAGGDSTDPEARRCLRALVPHPAVAMPPLALKIPRENPKMIELHELAATLGHACSELKKLEKSLGAAIATRMRQREGKFIWQTATGTIENFPLTAAMKILPERFRQDGVKIWSATAMTEIALLFGPLLAVSASFSAGATRAIVTPSERVIRVVATIIPSPSLAWKERMGIDHLDLEFQYVLADEDGEMHMPKDEKRIEIALAPELETEIRQQIVQDLLVMADAGAPLGPGFLRQLGRLEEAATVEARLHRLQQMESAQAGTAGKKRKASAPTWNIECILEELPAGSLTEPTFLVRWEGYHPSWEVYRATGNPGEPVTSWEPLSALVDNQALHTWREQA